MLFLLYITDCFAFSILLNVTFVVLESIFRNTEHLVELLFLCSIVPQTKQWSTFHCPSGSIHDLLHSASFHANPLYLFITTLPTEFAHLIDAKRCCFIGNFLEWSQKGTQICIRYNICLKFII